MLYNYQDCIEKYGSDYMMKKEIAAGTLYVKEKGVYSTSSSASELSIIMLKHPNAVCTGKSAYYYHSLTDVIPDHYYLATKRTDTRIKDSRVIQSYIKNDVFEQGIIDIEYNDTSLRIYNLERMLIELIRFRSKMPFDLYKEIIRNYREKVYEMDFYLVEEYADLFKNGEKIMETIQLEVL